MELVNHTAGFSPLAGAAKSRAPAAPPSLEPVAVVGLACRFPGGADDPGSFWRLLVEGVDAVREVSAARWGEQVLRDLAQAAPDLACVRWGGFVEGVERFDPAFFNISPREAARMDPQQRLFLEAAWEALENAGIPPDSLGGSLTGVFAGVHSQSNDYYRMQLARPERIEPYTSTGTAHSIIANRLSYCLGLRGPSLAVDTACSSSLVAVHLACRGLQTGECDLALAGGVNLMLSPETSIAYSKLQFLSPEGRCKTFDASADGFVRSEGCGVAVLRRVSDALERGDPILAVVRGSAVNQDGASNGLTAPSGLAQQEVVRAALKRAQVAPSEITFVETHGTGTALGDPIEIEALAAVLGPREAGAPRCRLGAVKTNLGHLESAAGIAGFVKAVLCLQRRFIPPNLHFRALNPHIALEGTPFEIPVRGAEWDMPDGQTRHAGVSSFGFGGTNAHVVLQEAPAFAAWPSVGRPAGQLSGRIASEEAEAARPEILPLSAKSDESLRALAESYRQCLKELADRPAQERPRLEDIAYTASVRRAHHPRRAVFVGNSTAQWLEGIEAFLDGGGPCGSSCRAPQAGAKAAARKNRTGTSGVAFVYSGQGPQWHAMGRELLECEPAFARAIESCDAFFRPLAGWSLREEICAEEPRSRMDQTAVAQPALFALQAALTELLRSWGVSPDAAVGHSVGEVAAAWAAGALSLEHAVRVVYHRSRLMESSAAGGAMAAVALSRNEAESLIARAQGQAVIAAVNSPRSVTLSGDARALEAILKDLDARGVFNRRLRVGHAFHSPFMDPCRARVEAALEGIEPREPAIPLLSTVTGAAGARFGPEYWGRNVREPVLFLDAVDRAIDMGFARFVEIAPHPVLANSVQECLAHRGAQGIAAPALRRGRPEREALLRALGDLYVDGYRVDWTRQHGVERRCVALPTYRWDHARYWIDEEPGAEPPEPAPPPIGVEDERTPEATTRDGLSNASGEERIEALTRCISRLTGGLLGLRSSAPIDKEAPLVSLGLDSLMAVEIRNRLQSEFAVSVSLAEILSGAAIRQLAEIAAARLDEGGAPAAPASRGPEGEGDSRFPLSQGQRALWFLRNLAPDSSAYNVAFVARVVSNVDPDALERAFQSIAQRHAALRTVYRSEEGNPYCMVLPAAGVRLNRIDASAWSDEELSEKVRAAYGEPFDLENGPVLRVHLFTRRRDEHVLLFAMHHLSCDGWSLGVMLDELREIYAGQTQQRPVSLPAPGRAYADYAAWQNEMLAGKEGERLRAYWENQLAAPLPTLDLPLDKERPEVQRYAGASRRFRLSDDLSREIEAFARAQGVTLYSLLLAAFQALLARYSGQEDILVGTPMAGRTCPEDERVVGYFINPVVLRSRVAGDPPFREHLSATRQTVLDALSNQDYPFPLLVRQLHPSRDASRSPLFQVLFNLHKRQTEGPIADLLYGDDEDATVDLGSLALKPYPLDQEEGQFDLTLEIADTGRGLTGVLKHNTDLFAPETAERMIRDYGTALRRVVEDPSRRLSEILPDAPSARAARPVRARKPTLVVAATFTAEPLADALTFWMEELDLPHRVRFAPYNQVFQQLLDPSSAFSRNAEGVNAVLVRIEDLLEREATGARTEPSLSDLAGIESNARELARVLRSSASRLSAPLVVCLCPASRAFLRDKERAAFAQRIESLVLSEIADATGLCAISSREILETYPMAQYDDPGCWELGRIPYTPVFFCALATMLARKTLAVAGPPFKVVALDCDQTLWKGVAGEDGPDGIEIDAPRRALQELMARQHDAGMLLCLCSMNEEQDVLDVFARRPEMPLSLDHLASRRIDWRPKSEKLRSLAQEMNLGLEGFILVDDNPVDCAEVRARCPEVLTIQLPSDPEQIEPCLRHVWAFDRAVKATSEDRARTAMYKEEKERERLRRETPTFAEFLRGLELRVTFSALSERSDGSEESERILARAAQLTHRTNQFNFTSVRRTESEMRALLRQKRLECLAVDASDRFGDYGMVGLTIFETNADVLRVDTFLLSCRALGRGVEHRILARLGEIAQERGLSQIELPFVPSARNAPALAFLESVAKALAEAAPDGRLYRLPAAAAVSATFDPPAEGIEPAPRTKRSERPGSFDRGKRLAAMQRIAHELRSADAILRAVDERAASRARASIPTGDFAPAASESEKAVERVWKSVLNLDKISINSNFFDLGGHSFLMPRIVDGLRKAFGAEVSLVEMFQHPTVRSMAACLERKTAPSAFVDGLDPARERATRQRHAIARLRRA